ncbi:MAG TPA: bile acid:sodium symporter [Candidatus Dormibacteraeota bacterium]|nr:bile acid:sodium symporter [Candidatus Dormibacteraeota bacterium]
MSPEKLVAVVVLVALTFGAGMQVDRDHLVSLLKNVGLLGRALLANFIIVPILGVLLALVFRLTEHSEQVATGFLLMAIAPGVPFVLSSVRKRGGRLSLAVELAIFLPLLSIITVPITAAWVLPAGAEARLPVAQFATTLVLFQLLPLLIGIFVGERFPAAVPRLSRPVQIVFFAAVLVLFVMVAPRLVHDVASVYGSNGMWAMLCLVLLSLAVGWALGGPAREDRRVLGIGTALRNIGLCAVIATASFGSGVVAAVLTYFLIQFVVTTLFGIYFTRTAKGGMA